MKNRIIFFIRNKRLQRKTGLKAFQQGSTMKNIQNKSIGLFHFIVAIILISILFFQQVNIRYQFSAKFKALFGGKIQTKINQKYYEAINFPKIRCLDIQAFQFKYQYYLAKQVLNIMAKHSNILVEQAPQEVIFKLKKSNKHSKDIKKLPHLRKQQLRKMACQSHSKKYLSENKSKGATKAQKPIFHQIIRSESLTCSICFEIIVGSALTQCGHIFCLNCIENVLFTSKQCPLCRSFMENQRFICPKIFDKIISKYVNESLNAEEIQNYQKRLSQFLQIQSKREIRCKLYVGDTLDYRVNMSWIAVRITLIEGEYVYLSQLDKNTCLDLSKPIHKQSRRLARCRTFTKQPPLRPTYYSDKMNIFNRTLSFIVEPPNFRSQSRNLNQNQNIPENIDINSFNPSRWEQFPNINNRNQWIFSDLQIPYEINQNIWNISNERDDTILFY